MSDQLIIKPIKHLILIAILAVSITGCGKTGDTAPDAVPSPTKATLTFPEQNSVCTTGTVISATESSINFTWKASDNTNTYELNIKNLLTSTTTTQTLTTNQYTTTLLRNTPYSWYVVSKSANTTTTAQSDVWKFYNSGLGIVSHLPFPADIVSPAFGGSITAAGGIVKLSWTGSDVDNDITGYDVYFGTTATPPLLKSAVTDSFLDNVAVKSGTTYYWKITTKDAMGNMSDSGVYTFSVN